MKKLFLLASLLIITVLGYSQKGFMIEANSSFAVPLEEFSEEPLGIGFGFNTNLGYTFTSVFGIYAGYQLMRFEQLEEADHFHDLYFKTYGYQSGIEIHRTIEMEELYVRVFGRLGATYSNLSINDPTDEVMHDDNKWGAMVEAGGALSLFSGVDVTLSLKTQRTSHDDNKDDQLSKNMTYMSGNLGLRKTF